MAPRFRTGPNLAILFLTAVVYSANAYGMAAGAFTSILSVALYDYFFSGPHNQIIFTAPGDVLAACRFCWWRRSPAISRAIFAARLPCQRPSPAKRALFQLTRDIAVAGDTAAIFRAIVLQCNEIFDCATTLLHARHRRRARYRTGLGAGPQRIAASRLSAPRIASARRDRGGAPGLRPRCTGRTRHQEAADMTTTFHPLTTSDGTVAVLALRDVAPAIVNSSDFAA